MHLPAYAGMDIGGDFMESKDMVYSPNYKRMREEGWVIQDIESGIHRYLKYFGTDTDYDQLALSYEEKNAKILLESICEEFSAYYKMEISGVELINRYQKGICVSAYTSQIHPAVYIDELFESTVTSFLLTSFLWSEFEEDLEVWKYAFSNMLYIFHEQCILGEMVSESALERLLDIVAEMDPHLVNLVTDCYWTILSFAMCHELAHIYFKRCGRDAVTKRQKRQEEFDADRMAYDVVLRMIMKDAQKPEKERTLYEYTYLAPMMLMEYFDLFYYTDRVLYKQWIEDGIHPTPIERKNQLFGIVDKPEYQLNTEEGNALYHGLLDVTDIHYKPNLLLKMERGKLNSLLDIKRRAARLQKEE